VVLENWPKKWAAIEESPAEALEEVKRRLKKISEEKIETHKKEKAR